jgi:hypothetical protein
MAVLDRHEPTMRMLTYVIIAIAVVGFASLAVIHFISKSTLRKTLQGVGVAINKVTRAAKEIERKTFHIMGLLVPLIHLLLLENGFSHNFCAGICWCITVAGWSFEVRCQSASRHLLTVSRRCSSAGSHSLQCAKQ